MRLGFGEVEPANRRDAITVARDSFLVCIEEIAPQVLHDLLTIPIIENKQTLKHLLWLWATDWNLNTTWCIKAAQNTMDSWSAFKEAFGQLPEQYIRWSPVGGSSLVRQVVDIKPLGPLYSWKAEAETREQYLEYAKKEIRNYIRRDALLLHLSPKIKTSVIDYLMKKVEGYCDEVQSAYLKLRDANGRKLWKVSESKAKFSRSVDWAVKFQILGQGFTQIAKANEVNASTVEREVESVLTLIKLPKRNVPKGRPRGAKDSKESQRQLYKDLDLPN